MINISPFTRRVARTGVAHRRLVRISVIIGIITFVGGGLWLVAGAGMFGSPVDIAFEVSALTGLPHYWEFWILWIVVAGPMALLPYALLERFFPRVGASAMILAAIFVAEAGIRSGRNNWGYSDVDALIVIGCIATPMLLLALSLLVLGAQPIRWQALSIALLATILWIVWLGVRFNMERKYWNANYPLKKIEHFQRPLMDSVEARTEWDATSMPGWAER